MEINYLRTYVLMMIKMQKVPEGQERRNGLRNKMHTLLEHAGEMNEDDLSYVISNLLRSHISKCKSAVNFVSLIGVLECVKLELYNQVVEPHHTQRQMDAGGPLSLGDTLSPKTIIAREIKRQTEKIDAYEYTYCNHGCDTYEEYFRDNYKDRDILEGMKIGYANFEKHPAEW